MFNIAIRPAQPTESSCLTDIAFQAKRYWGYPESFIETWRSELTITENYIEHNTVYIASHGNSVVGFYSLVLLKEECRFGTVFMESGIWLDHMFIIPSYIGNGIGTIMVNHLKTTLLKWSAGNVMVFVDPFATGFYEKMGARFIRESDSSIPGRKIPVYQLFL